MRGKTFYTLCIPLVDIYIYNPDVIIELGIEPNAMTLYQNIQKEGQEILVQYENKSCSSRKYYGGMSYNTCAEIAKTQGSARAVFLGPFSTDKLSTSVFERAIAGEIKNLTIHPEYIDSESGRSYVIPKGSNRAMITKINEKQVISMELVERFISLVKEGSTKEDDALYLAGYTVEQSTKNLEYLLDEKNLLGAEYTLIFNLADPGVLKRSYRRIKKFIEKSDWIIGNTDEFTELFHQETQECSTDRKSLHDYIGHRFDYAVVTDGSGPVTVYAKINGKKCVLVKQPEDIKVKNPTGAGDVFAATFFSHILVDASDVQGALDSSVARTSEYLTRLTGRMENNHV
ncbi:hypothetical protein NEAUS03_1372 [Nematocida ausubeli]|nr:hypothetical protein NEAUS03_1372 [Nematocida ausubeli]